MKIAAGQVAVVTGGASGIGFGLAEEFAARGLKVVISDVRPDVAREAAAKLTDSGATCIALATDVSDPAQVDHLAAETMNAFGRVDVVCNNAGIVCKIAPMWEQTHRTWQWLTDVMLLGVVSGVRAFTPHFLTQGSGHFVNTASAGGLITLPYLTPYNAVKHAVVGMTETLNIELRGINPNIGASVLCPGMVATSLGESSAQNCPDGAEVTTASSNVDRANDLAPNGSPVLQPRDVALAVIEGIESDRLHILPAGDGVKGMQARIKLVLDDIAHYSK